MGKGLGHARRRLINKIVEKTWRVEDPSTRQYSFRDILYIVQEMFDNDGIKFLEAEDKSTPNTGYHTFRSFVKHLFYRNAANYDSMVLITSDKGSGKSSAAIMMARFWQQLLGKRFDPAKHMAYTNKEVVERITNLEPFSPLICDEAINFASASEWAKKENKELKKKLAVIRTKHLFFILCFPLKINKLEKTYLESFTNYWIDLFGRGLGAIYVKDKNPVNDSWRMKDFKSVGSYTEFTELSRVEKKLKKHPNFWRLIKFPKPPDWLYTKYLQVREKNVYDSDSIRNDVTSEDVHNALMILALQDIMMNDSTKDMHRISLHIKQQYSIPISKKHIRDRIMDARQLIDKIREEQM